MARRFWPVILSASGLSTASIRPPICPGRPSSGWSPTCGDNDSMRRRFLTCSSRASRLRWTSLSARRQAIPRRYAMQSERNCEISIRTRRPTAFSPSSSASSRPLPCDVFRPCCWRRWQPWRCCCRSSARMAFCSVDASAARTQEIGIRMALWRECRSRAAHGPRSGLVARRGGACDRLARCSGPEPRDRIVPVRDQCPSNSAELPPWRSSSSCSA